MSLWNLSRLWNRKLIQVNCHRWEPPWLRGISGFWLYGVLAVDFFSKETSKRGLTFDRPNFQILFELLGEFEWANPHRFDEHRGWDATRDGGLHDLSPGEKAESAFEGQIFCWWFFRVGRLESLKWSMYVCMYIYIHTYAYLIYLAIADQFLGLKLDWKCRSFQISLLLEGLWSCDKVVTAFQLYCQTLIDSSSHAFITITIFEPEALKLEHACVHRSFCATVVGRYDVALPANSNLIFTWVWAKIQTYLQMGMGQNSRRAELDHV